MQDSIILACRHLEHNQRGGVLLGDQGTWCTTFTMYMPRSGFLALCSQPIGAIIGVASVQFVSRNVVHVIEACFRCNRNDFSGSVETNPRVAPRRCHLFCQGTIVSLRGIDQVCRRYECGDKSRPWSQTRGLTKSFGHGIDGYV